MSDYKDDKDPALEAARQRSQQIAQFIKENRAAPNKGIGGHVRDLGLTALSGAVSVPELAVGLADIPTGGRVGKFLENEDGAFGFRPGEAKAAIAGAKTKRSQEQLQEFTDTEGLGGKVGYALKNPSLITNTVVESLPSMFAGGVIGRGLGAAAKGLSPVAAGALGEGAVGAGLAAEQIRQQTDDGLLTGKQASLAAATGATTAGFGFAGGKIAQKLGIGDIDTIVAGGGRTATPGSEIVGSNAVSKGIARRAGEGALSEGLLEELPQSVSETILQNEALGRPLDEGVTDAAALGLLSGAAMGAGAGMFAKNRRPEDRITPTEDMGQEGADYGPSNPNNPLSGRGLPNPTPLLENQAAPQLGFQGRASNQFNAGPDGEVFTGDQYNEYLAGQQERARQARDSGGLQDIRDITPTPQGYDQAGNDPRLPAPDGTDFTASQDGQVYGRDDINTRLSQERDAAAERRARIARGEIIDRTPIPEAPKPSELMGIDPNKGSLSAAAALAVDSGASDVGNQLRDAVAQEPQMSVWQSGMMDRLSNADQNNSTYARLAQAMQNEPASVSEKARLMREADALPRAEVAAKQIKPNTRVLDEVRAQTKAYTPEGKEVQAQWDVVDASDLVTSNTDSFTINPDFPASRQPRDRTRASAQQQVNEIASKLQPNLLGESPDVSTGAPFVGANDNIVDSGNGRSMAIRRVYQEGGEKAGEYRQFVNEQAAKFGLDTDAVNMMQSPVLVRRNTSDINRDEFARAANKPTAARMSSTEQAASDAKNLPDASLLSFNGDGNMSLYQSQQYLKNFIAKLPSTEQSAMMDDKGALSREGKNRIEAAIVQDAYNNPKLVSAISEKLDNDTTNVLRAVTDKAPQISQINADVKTGDLHSNTLARDIADATQAYMDIKNSDQDIDDYLSQDSLFDDGLTDGAKEILGVLSDNKRSAKAIGEYIQSRINEVTGRGNPKQVSMFDDDIEADAPNVLSSEPAPTNTQAQPANTKAEQQPTTELESSNDIAIGKDGKPKWFSNAGKAKAFIDKKDIGATHEVVQAGKRFEILPKAQENQSAQEKTADNKLAEKHGFNEGNKLDHGELSIPNRTKNIDNEIDRYKADKAKQDKREREDKRFLANEREAARKPARERADELYKQHGKVLRARVKDKIYGTGNTPAEWLKNEARANPENFIKMAEQIISESEAETNPQLPVDKPETKAESPTKPPQSSVAKTETAPETQKPTGDWQTQMNGNEFRINEDGITVRKHDRVVHIRGANSITANKKAKELAGQDIRELHYIAAKEDANDPFSEGSIWLDGNGDMVRKKGTKKPTGSLSPILKQAEAETKKPTAKKADKPATPIETVAEIEDFGEKITGARKDMQSFYQKEMTDDDIINQPLSKIWPKKDIDAIEDTQMAALATALRSTIPTKPRKGYRLNSWVNKVKSTRGIMQNMLSSDMPANEFISQLTQIEAVADIGYQAQLLAQLDKEQWSRIDKVDPQIGYQKRNENGDYIPFVGFAVTIDKRTHTFNTEQRDISEIIDKVNNLLGGEVKTQALKFDLYSRGRGDAKSWFITQASDKDKTPLIEFNDRDAARSFLKENNSELSELWDQHKERVNVKKSDMRSNVNRERIGPDHRSGQDVTTEQFMTTFGLRGGQFGNWVKQGANSKDRQNMLNDAYDAFMDLAGVLNIPPEAIGLGGKLAMSFGARGKGRAMAHYEPSQVIINLTKTQGAGSLAHEWFHALDNHFTSFRDDPNRLTSKENAYITYKPEPMLIMKDQNGKPSRMRPITEARRKQLYEMNKNRAYLPENFLPDPNHKEGVRPQVEAVFADLVETLDESPMKARAVTIDKGAADGYWSRIIERAARAFEGYVINKLEKQGARSDFLANVTPEDAFPRNMDRYPYLLQSEMAPVAEAFDNLFATIDSKASEDGNGKTLFSRAGQLNQAIDKVKAGAVGSTNTTRQQVLAKLNDKFGKETIAKLMADGKLDIKVLSDFMQDGKLTIPSDVDGLYHNGKATLIADNLSDDMIIPTFLHELGGHGGMQGLMDKKAYDALMKDFDSLVKAGDPLAMQAKAMADKVARNEQDALDEYLPYLITLTSRQQAKQGKVAGMINRMVMAIRSWLKNTLGVPIAINSQDILSLAERMVNEIEKQGSLDNVANSAPQFSDPNIPDKQLQDVRDQYENTDQWMTAPNGKPTNLTENQWVQTRTPAFKQWFGDWENDPKNASKIVDDNGEPRITYHQTDDTWNTFDKSKAKAGKHDNETPTGIFVKGSDRDIGIGENLNQMPLFTNIKNPLELKDRQAAKKYYESNIDGYADIVASMKKDDDTYSKALDEAESSIQAELKRRYETGDRSQSSKELFKKSRDILNEWTASQQANSLAAKKLIDDHLAENDIDGVVLEVDEGSFGRETDAIIAINNNQIKSATDNIGTFDNTNPDIRFSDPNVPTKQLDDVRDKYEGTDEWMKSPNGSDTNLTEQQWLQVRTPAFKEWFGDWEGDAANASKVVDDNGEPMVVYHGTGNDFNIFEKSKAVDKEGRQMMMGWGKDKFYFADNEMGAKVAASAAIYYGKGKNERVIPAFLNIRNPISAEDYSEQVGRPDTPRKRDNIINKLDQSLTNQGYDGIIDKESGGIASFNSNQIKSATDNVGTFDNSNPDIRFSRAAGMNDEFDPRNIAKETATRLYDWASSAPPGKLSWWHKTIGTMYNLAQRNPYFKPVFENTEKFINDVSFYAAKASELAPRLLPQLDSLRDITKSAIGAKDNEALSKPIFEGTLLWGRDLDGKAVLVEDWRKKVMATSKQDRLQMLRDANRITPAQLQQLATLNNIQANRFINGIIDEEVNAGLVWKDSELRSKFDLSDEQIELYREFRSATDKSLDSLTRSDMLRRLGKDANDIETAVMEAGTLREAVFNIEQHINSLIQASPKKEKALKETLKDIKESQFRTNKLIDDGYAPLSRFGQYTVDVVDSDGNREYFGMFESAYEARKMEAEMKALYDDPATHTVSRGTLSNEEFKLFAGVTPETAELFGEMLGLDATGDKAADEAFQEYLKRTKNNRSAMKRLMHRKGIKGYSEDVGRVLASFIYSNARHTSAALNMSNIDRAITDIPKGEGQLKDAAVKLAEYIKNPQEEAQLMRGWMFAQYLGGSIASAVVNITQPIAVSFPYLSQFGGAVKAASQLGKASSDWTKAFKDKDRGHFEPDLLAAIERAEADGTLSPQEVHNLLKQASGKNPLSAGDGTKVGDARALAGNTLSRVSLAWGALFSGAEQINRRVTFVAAYRMAVEQGMANPAEFATKSIKETQFVYNKASRMNWGRGAVGGTLMTFKTYTVSYIELMHRLWNQGEKGSPERAQGRKATMIMLGVMFMLSGSGGLPFMEDAEDLIDGIGQIMGYNFSTKKSRQDFLDAWFGEMLGDFLESGASTLPGSPTDVSGRLGLGNLIPGTGIFKERTNNTRDVLEIAGPAGDFAGRIATGTRDIAKGVANLDATSLKKGALEFAPTAVRNAVKGVDMASSGIYKDTKGYKVTDVSPVDAAFKFAGFQPLKVSKIQEANYLGQTATSYYSLRASNIRALWAAGVVEGNSSKVADAKAAVKDWNEKNPDQKIVIRPTDIARRVREMKMDKSERVTKLAPKSMRAQMASDFSQVRDGF